jgi:hypothetical protein
MVFGATQEAAHDADLCQKITHQGVFLWAALEVRWGQQTVPLAGPA